MAWKGSSPEYDVPDPAEVIRMVRNRYGKVWRKKGLLTGLALLGVWAAVSSYYQVEPDEVGVIRRLGRYAGVTDPGPHFKIPLIETVTKVPVQRQMKMEFGFRTAATGTRTSYAQGNDHLRESLMLTGDLNVAVVEWIVQYKIKDPSQYLFKVRNVSETLATLAEASMRYVVGDHSVNEVLTTGRQKVADKAKVLLQQLADRYECGVDVQQVVLQDVNPPDPVKPSFNEVNEAIQEKERAINEAQAEMNKELPRARGEAEQLVRAAEGYAIERVNRARGEAERFVTVYQEYQKAPDITRRRMYLETLSKLLPRVGTKVVVDDAAKGMTPILQMDRAPMSSARAAAVAGGDR
ncbi:MAG TPA: FtsH protease activity modulator HflK [Myxococcales bacterium]|jgi:membrane protease subunit HflK|nr:FtsH protease activity modulator HflK [Myxococcales bacterium]